MRLSWPMTLNWAKLSFLSLHFSMETRKIELNTLEMELISLCVDAMGDPGSRLQFLEAILSQQDLEAYHSLHERVCRW
jgi:hypothetical protein